MWRKDQIEEEYKNCVPYNPFKADIFSLGILLCEIVANTPRLYCTQTLYKLKNHKLEAIILNCLKDNPNERPDTKDLLQNLNFFSQSN